LLSSKEILRINSISISGGGPLEFDVKHKVKKLMEKGLPIKLNGFVDKSKATRLIQESDFVMIPSRIESIPVIFSDAIQLLRPVISMPVGDLPVLLDKYKCGVLASEVSPRSFATAISKALFLDIEEMNNDLKYTRENFYIKQMNYLKFLEVINKHDKIS
jgi:glycosyltransferase involved in cell wall biosynthesis